MVAFFNAKAAAPSLTKMNDYLKAKNYAGLFSISCNDKSKKYSANSWYNIREHEPGYAYRKEYEILAKNAEVSWYTYPNGRMGSEAMGETRKISLLCEQDTSTL